jgi:hypothetical protein
MKPDMARLEVIENLRTVWPNEAQDFTPWLQENADTLAEALGIDLELTACEQPVGPFFVDVIGRDLSHDCVLIVENQLTATDHNHLGQLVTYAANTDAATIVWMAPSFRDEHRQAIAYLNDLAGDKARYFAVEIAAARIADSPPAPLFRVVGQPNESHARASTAAKTGSQVSSGKGALYMDFWARFLDRVHLERPNWTRSRKPTAWNWISLPSQFKGGTYYAVSFTLGHRMRYELYIDDADGDEVASRFAGLVARRSEIETSFGGALSWEELPGRRASRVAAYRDGDVTETAAYDEYIDWFIETGTRLRSALDPYA